MLAEYVKSRLIRIRELPRTLPRRAQHQTGWCAVCGRASRFLASSDNLKESLHCAHCRAWTRVRLMADLLVRRFARDGARSLRELVREPWFRSLRIHEAQASGPLNAVLCACPGYIGSELLRGVAPGELRGGVRCEDLQALSFEDASLDLVLHSSVLEHVPCPERALAEAWRVLRAGGHLIFEVPMTERGIPGVRASSVKRAELVDGELVHLLEPAYHDDPLCAQGVLVFTDFGADVAQRLTELGFEVELETTALPGSTMSHAVLVVARKR